MSSFDVKTRKITSVIPHPNADKLDLVQIGGYYAVCQKGIHATGDLILYIPEDAVFTDMAIAEKMQVTGYLTGKEKNRVKAIRLRGSLSQGIVLPFSVLDEVTSSLGFGYYEHKEGIDLQEELKIEKYEEPIPIEMAGQVRSWPSFVPHYGVENAKRPESVGLIQDGEEVIVTEKLHGTNITVALGPGLEEGEVAFVCSRNNALKESDTNVYWRAAKQYKLVEKLGEMVSDVMLEDFLHGEEPTLSLHGEVVGVQDLKYGYSNGEVGFFAFDIMLNGRFLDYDRFVMACNQFGIPRVPELYRGPHDLEVIKKVVQGNTTLPAEHIREGGVEKPVTERTVEGVRAIVKHIHDEYLIRKGGSEYH